MASVSEHALPERVVVVTGPTASGKTELAAALARALGGEVVGADSRQVYREMDAGTAKPSAALRAEIPHHMIDVVDPGEDFDAASWRSGALAALAGIAVRGRVAIVCGGTGLYVRSLVRGLFRGPGADAPLRERLRAEERARPGTLRARLCAVDPPAAARIHPNDEVRTVRALEVHALTGRPISAWHDEHALAERPFETLTLEVTVEPAQLVERIEARSRAIVEAGIVEEMASLRGQYGRGAKAFDAIGYREAGRCLDGTLALEKLAEAIARSTRAYAKRQRVWLRRQEGALAVAFGDHEGALAHAAAFLDVVANRQGIG